MQLTLFIRSMPLYDMFDMLYYGLLECGWCLEINTSQHGTASWPTLVTSCLLGEKDVVDGDVVKTTA